MTIDPADAERLADVIARGVSRAILDTLDPSKLAAEKVQPDRRGSAPVGYETVRVALDATTNWARIAGKGQAIWIRSGGSSGLLIAYNEPPADDERSLTGTNGLNAESSFQSLWARVSSATSGQTAEILVFHSRSAFRQLSESGGELTSFGEAQPIYPAAAGGSTTQGTFRVSAARQAVPATESALPVFLARDGGTTELKTEVARQTPDADNGALLHVVPRGLCRVLETSVVELASGASFTSAEYSPVTDSDGITAPAAPSDGDLGALWSMGVILFRASNAATNNASLIVLGRVVSGEVLATWASTTVTDNNTKAYTVPMLPFQRVSFRMTNDGAGAQTAVQFLCAFANSSSVNHFRIAT